MTTILRGQANKPVGGDAQKRKKPPKHRNELESWNVEQIHRHPNFEVGDELNVRGLAATGSRVGSAIRGSRPEDVVTRLAA